MHEGCGEERNVARLGPCLDSEHDASAFLLRVSEVALLVEGDGLVVEVVVAVVREDRISAGCALAGTAGDAGPLDSKG